MYPEIMELVSIVPEGAGLRSASACASGLAGDVCARAVGG